MIRFVGFESTMGNGERVFINPSFITEVFPDPKRGTCLLSYQGDEECRVKGTADEVIAKIIGGSHDDTRITALEAENAALRARVAELEDADSFWNAEGDDDESAYDDPEHLIDDILDDADDATLLEIKVDRAKKLPHQKYAAWRIAQDTENVYVEINSDADLAAARERFERERAE